MRFKFAWPLLTMHAHQCPGWIKGKGNRVQEVMAVCSSLRHLISLTSSLLWGGCRHW